MTARIEMSNAADVNVEVVGAETVIGDDTLIIEGTKEQLLDRLNRAVRNLAKLR